MGFVADEQALAFWDSHQHINQDPTYWMAQPQCRLAINRRVCGEPYVWPLDAFKRFVGRRFKRGLSLGSGSGNLERAARQLDLCEEIEGVDGSEASVSLARSKASEEGLSGISYRSGNLNTLRLPRGQYDVVFFHASLHHVRSIEKLLARVERAMTPDGVLFIEEWVGPSRDEWNDAKMSRMRALYDQLPPSWKLVPILLTPRLRRAGALRMGSGVELVLVRPDDRPRRPAEARWEGRECQPCASASSRALRNFAVSA
jgi:SAM-dependent methyltransferase